MRVIEQMTDGSVFELSVLVTMQVNNPHALNTTHPEIAVAGHDRAYTPSDIPTALEGLFETARLETIEEHSIVTAYPHTVVNGVIG